MKALYFEQFGDVPLIKNLPDPTPEPHGVVVEVKASGLCRSDWHGWQGHDPDINLPHVPGHELAGVIAAIGKDVMNWQIGDRVTVPFVGGCGTCPQCYNGHQHICDSQFQPGFTHWGSFAQFVSIHYADLNLVSVPAAIEFSTAASLGCRFATSFRAVIDQGRVKPGEWVTVFGCGGVGLSAIMIASAMGARVIAIDLDDRKLKLAQEMGATMLINGLQNNTIEEEIIERTKGGAHLGIDAIGNAKVCYQSINSLRKRARHVQIGLMVGQDADPAIPMSRIIGYELEILGSHGMQAWRYPEMIDLVLAGRLSPDKMIGKSIALEEAGTALVSMDTECSAGITIINRF